MYSILLVDDEKAIREYLPKAIQFEEYGFMVTDTAMNGQEAMDKLEAVEPDLILLDIRMPVMDGLQFLKALRNSPYSSTYVVMLSGYSDFAYAKEAMKYGVKAYLTKPVDDEEIIPLLKELRIKLDENNMKNKLTLARRKINKLNNLFCCTEVDRTPFLNYTLMTCLINQSDDIELENPHTIIQDCISSVIGEIDYYLFRITENQYTFLLSNEFFGPLNNKEDFSSKIDKELNKYGISCTFFFDSYIFEHNESTFREDFFKHIHNMMTERFYTETCFIDYGTKAFGVAEELSIECKCMDEIEKHLSSCDKTELLEIFEKLMNEIQNVHLGVRYVQEIGQRIHYIIVQELALTDNQTQWNEVIEKPDFIEETYFITFKTWSQQNLKALMDGLNYLENNHKMSNISVGKEVIDYVNQHYMEQISLKKIADKFFMNATYLGRAFQKATGVNFKQYINTLRINEAKRLLLNTNKLIYEIANQVGYPESKYFVVKFMQEVGMSPTEYRNQIL